MTRSRRENQRTDWLPFQSNTKTMASRKRSRREAAGTRDSGLSENPPYGSERNPAPEAIKTKRDGKKQTDRRKWENYLTGCTICAERSKGHNGGTGKKYDGEAHICL